MKNYFVTGTDTGVGKTLASAVLTSVLDGHYWKPIQSGTEDEDSDSEQVQQLINLSRDRIFPSTYELKASLSPHHAAYLENKTLSLNSICLPATQKSLIVEGAGGIFVPINDDASMLDVMAKLNLPIIIVARGSLGTINHTLMTIEILRQRHLTIHGIIFSGELNPLNKKTIEQWGKVRTLFHIPYFASMNEVILQQWLREQKQNILSEFV